MSGGLITPCLVAYNLPVLSQKLSNPQGGNISGYNLVRVSL